MADGTTEPEQQTHDQQPDPVEPETTQDATAQVEQGVDSSDDTPEGAEALGDPGKKALASMKEQRNAAREQVRTLTQKLEQAQQSGSATEGRVQSLSEQVVKANVLAAAKGALTNPEDAFAFLQLDQFEVGEDGNVDTAAIDQAISGLVEDRPYLAGEPRRFQGSAAGGGHESDPAQAQVTRDDLKDMSPDQVMKAHQEGRLKSLLKRY